MKTIAILLILAVFFGALVSCSDWEIRQSVEQKNRCPGGQPCIEVVTTIGGDWPGPFSWHNAYWGQTLVYYSHIDNLDMIKRIEYEKAMDYLEEVRQLKSKLEKGT